VGTDPAGEDARAWARLGFEAQRRYFTGYTGAREALTLASAFLAAGATGVIGSRWEAARYRRAER
jgi:hypothetical protein